MTGHLMPGVHRAQQGALAAAALGGQRAARMERTLRRRRQRARPDHAAATDDLAGPIEWVLIRGGAGSAPQVGARRDAYAGRVVRRSAQVDEAAESKSTSVRSTSLVPRITGRPSCSTACWKITARPVTGAKVSRSSGNSVSPPSSPSVSLT